jgi:4'-phosphopantetheinyl transferase EntD
LLVFDVWIYDAEGLLFEAVLGVLMRDVSAGRMKPPQWVVAEEPENRHGRIVNGHHVLSLIELGTVMPFAEKALSGIELKRLKKMGDKRRLSYVAARLACKRLSRKLSDNDMDTPAADINTVRPDFVQPCCPLTDGRELFLCAASHDSRFAVAVASRQRVGVDVEMASERVLKGQDLYMCEEEKALVEDSYLGKVESSLRVWSIKEAVCKALSTNLADSWKRVQVTDIGHDRSYARIDNKDGYVVFHGAVDQHLFTIVEMA